MVNEKLLPQKSISYDAGKITVNVFTVVSIVGFFMGITYLGVTERQKIREEFRQEIKVSLGETKREFQEIKKELQVDLKAIKEDDHSHHNKLDDLENKMRNMLNLMKQFAGEHELLLDEAWTKNDLALWCYEVQKKNENFQCPDYEELKRLGLFSHREHRNHKSLKDFNIEEN